MGTDVPVREARSEAPAILSPTTIRSLEMAFRVASALPADPHIKARARAQEEVAVACLDLCQPDRALDYLASLETWRRGAGLTKVALYLAEHGAVDDAECCLDQAERIARSSAAAPLEQNWRSDRIRAGIARARIALGQLGAASAIEAALDPAATAQVLPLRAQTAVAATFESTLAGLDQVLETASFDGARGALDACVILFDRFYADPERRDLAEHRILHAYAKLPLAVRVDLVLRLVDVALAHAGRERAVRLLGVTDGLMSATRWLPEDEIAILARRGALRHRAGEAERAGRDLRTALAMFEEGMPRIVDISRASALRAIAAAYHATDHRAAAMSLYRRAVEAGVENPNSRPRAEDLVATCLALARLAIEPDPALWERMLQVERGLTDPW